MAKNLDLKSLNVWFITDDKPGHLNQLKGLESRLSVHAKIQSKWLSVADNNLSWLSVFLKRLPQDCLTEHAPDIVVGAGHRTHKLILALKRRFHCFSVLLMKPSVPVSWFDALIIPEHDSPPNCAHILPTVGVLNNVVPILDAKQKPANKGLILIGGESKHYQWDENNILDQVEDIVSKSPNISFWVLGNSRRTPISFINKLKERSLNNVLIVEHQNTDRTWLPQQMSDSGKIWVTPDSVSMVYESITSGTETNIFKMDCDKQTRVVKGIERLLLKSLVVEWPNLNGSLKDSVLWEAERAAIWLIDRYRPTSQDVKTRA